MGRKPSIDKETPREKMRKGLRKRTLQSIRETALDGIKEIKARIHRIVVSGQEAYKDQYSWETLNQAFGGSLHLNKDFDPSERSGNYGTMCIINIKHFQVNLLLNRLKPHRPPIQIEIHPRGDISVDHHKDFLIWLNK